MPRGLSHKLLERVNEIDKYVNSVNCVLESEISRVIGLTSTEAYYSLNFMVDKGLLKKYEVGHNTVYCTKDATLTDVYDKLLRYHAKMTLRELWKTVCRNIATFKTKYALVTVSRLISIHRGRRKEPLLEVSHPKLNSALAEIIKYILADAVIGVEKRRKTMLRINVESAKRRCL
jgi:hypothetical protein